MMPRSQVSSKEKDAIVKQLKAEGTITTKLRDAFREQEDAMIFFTTCAIDGELEAVEALINSGVDIDGLVQDDYTALHLAAQEGHLDVVKLLVAKGANIHTETHEKGRYAFYSACLHGHLPVVKFLCPMMRNIDKKIRSGVTPLNATCGNGHLEVVKYLVHAGADVNIADNDGVTPMRVACWKGYLDIVKYLKEAGADIDKCANDESTPLSAASYNGNISVVVYLIENGAEIDRRDDDGMTPLYAAACNGHLDVVRYLLECGADKSIPDSAGTTVAQVALGNGHEKICRYLQNYDDLCDQGVSTAKNDNSCGDQNNTDSVDSGIPQNEVHSLKSEIKDLKNKLEKIQKWYHIGISVIVLVVAIIVSYFVSESRT